MLSDNQGKKQESEPNSHDDNEEALSSIKCVTPTIALKGKRTKMDKTCEFSQQCTTIYTSSLISGKFHFE